MRKGLLFGLLVAAMVMTGCRGALSDKPPVHPNLNMDFQEKFQAQEANDFFEDGRAMRPPVPGTVARGFLRDDSRFYYGRDETGAYVDVIPVNARGEELRAVIERGRDRYGIYCSVCHGDAGDGQGIIMVGNEGRGYGYVPAPTFYSDLLASQPDGYFYDVITNGVRNMPGYAQQIPVADRWAIVSYIRALQSSQRAIEGEIPASILAQIEQGRSANLD